MANGSVRLKGKSFNVTPVLGVCAEVIGGTTTATRWNTMECSSKYVKKLRTSREKKIKHARWWAVST